MKVYDDSGSGITCDEVMIGRRRGHRPTMFLLAVLAVTMQAGAALAMSGGPGSIEVKVNIPKEAEVGKSTTLTCNWKLMGSNNKLYSVKWYKDEYEFFSYNPDEPNLQDQIKTFARKGVNIDTNRSGKNQVHLNNLSLDSSGQYRCEVSTGPPFYAVNVRDSNLTVLSLPSDGPEIRGLASNYAIGDNVTANCTAWPSVPKATLQWTINNRTALPKYIIEHPPLAPIESQGTPNSLGLRFELNARHFASSPHLTVGCIAQVGSRRFETAHRVQLTHANNQRYSAGEIRNAATANSAICGAVLPLLVFAGVLVT